MTTTIVSIAGKPGSGKSTVAKALALRLGLDHVSAGDFMREMADERGLSVLELGRLAEADDRIDREIDERSRRFGQERDGFVIDARLAWHFIPHSFKVFLDVDLDVAAARIFEERRASETENVDLETTRRNVTTRAASEASRYQAYYGIDTLDSSNYDLVIDASHAAVEAIVDEIEAALQARAVTG